MKYFRAILIICTLLTVFAVPQYAAAGIREDAVSKTIAKHIPEGYSVGTIKAKSVTVNKAKKSVKIVFNDAASYIPFSKTELDALKRDCLAALGKEYKAYKADLYCGQTALEKLCRYAPKKNTGPTEDKPFIVRKDKAPAPAGLDGANIALWQSHGWYFEPKLNRWEWQRARIFQTVEDLYTQSYVMPFLMPMLENAGAYVMSPRERDISRTEIIIDNDSSDFTKGIFETSGHWSRADKKGFAYTHETLHNGDHPFDDGTALKAKLSGTDVPSASAKWNAAITHDGRYAVYISYASLPNSSTEAEYIVNAADGEHRFTVNQRMGGGTWIYLGHFPLHKTSKAQTIVELLNTGTDKNAVVTADAVKIGGGMGNVARIVKEPVDDIDYEYSTSGYPRFTEGARYFLQWAGAPDSVFTPTAYENDYNDDYRSRALWANWLAGGSSMLPDSEGLGIPLDLCFAFHSDAGTTPNDSIIGTLGIYCTNGKTTGNGSNRLASRDLTDEIMTNIVNDIRAGFEPQWTRRGMWDKSYFEAREPEVPTMLLELLSHQNFADMAYGLDPAFRFAVSRAVYKGIAKFIAKRDKREYVIQPLPVRSFAINKKAPGQYRLSWLETVDSLESTAKPSHYIIEERVNDGAFRRIANTEEMFFDIDINDKDIHSFRIIAANDGGTSFPSEVLAMCEIPGSETVTVVNGFTRISAPDRFDSGDIAGFYDAKDHGVPYVNDISFVGSQFEFRRAMPWMDDDAAGFGASRANYEDKVIAGNTFDFVKTHGEAIRDAGYSFVSSSAEAFENAQDTPAAVDLILGKQKEIKQGRGAYGTRFKAFPEKLQERIAYLTSKGTDFFVSGAYIASDIWDNHYSTEQAKERDKAFASEILGYKWRVGQASTAGDAYQTATRFSDFGKGRYRFYTELNDSCYAVESPDAIIPSDKDKGCTIIRYGENNLPAAIAFDGGNYRTVAVGFPFETIKDAESRRHLMKQVLDFFKNPSPKQKTKRK